MSGNIYRFSTKQALLPGFSDAEDYCQIIDLYGDSSLQEKRFIGCLGGLNGNDLLALEISVLFCFFGWHAHLTQWLIADQQIASKGMPLDGNLHISHVQQAEGGMYLLILLGAIVSVLNLMRF